MNSEATAQLSAQITEFHIMKANVVKPFAMYSIEVRTINNIGDVTVQKIYRLEYFSDFFVSTVVETQKYLNIKEQFIWFNQPCLINNYYTGPPLPCEEPLFDIIFNLENQKTFSCSEC